jgi:hypothetical protein
MIGAFFAKKATVAHAQIWANLQFYRERMEV